MSFLILAVLFILVVLISMMFVIVLRRTHLAKTKGAIGPESYGRARFRSLAYVLGSASIVAIGTLFYAWGARSPADHDAALTVCAMLFLLYVIHSWVTYDSATRQLRQHNPGLLC